MRNTFAILLIVALVASTKCWETACLVQILDQMSFAIGGEDIKLANDTLVALYNTAEVNEIYDIHIHYNTDYKDRIGEDTNIEAFIKAETMIGLPFVTKIAKSTAADKKATTQYYYYGACCYYFNPCIGLKLGYHLSIPITDVQEKLDESVFIASIIKTKQTELTAVIKAKGIKSQDKTEVSTS